MSPQQVPFEAFRREEEKRLRIGCAEYYGHQPVAIQHPNGDTAPYQVYSKGLVHDSKGVVTQSSLNSLLKALKTKTHADFEAIEVGFTGFDPKHLQKLTDPQAGLAYDTEGPDTTQFALPAAPAFNSRETMGEIAENYWMALLRDVPFDDYDGNAVAQAAAAHLTTFGSDFKGPKNGNTVTTDTLFRADLPGATTGPYLSQFMVWDVPYGAQKTPAQVAFGFPKEQDYMVKPDDYLQAQAGYVASKPQPLNPPLYMLDGRAVSNYVHIDELFQAYLNGCLLMITPTDRGGFGVPIAPGNPYATSMTQMGFGTLGEPNFKVMVAEVATRALKAVWYQKWFVHRRLRPEAFAARVHFTKTAGENYGLNLSGMDDLLNRVKAHNANLYSSADSYLLPMAFPEGCPTHPAYGAGHATVAGACVTVLKALFQDKTFAELGVTPIIRNDQGDIEEHPELNNLTAFGELDKLAANIGMGRNIAGVHWRSDFTASIQLGECVGLNFLRETAATYHEDVSFTIPLFSGQSVTIHKDSPRNWSPSDFPCGA